MRAQLDGIERVSRAVSSTVAAARLAAAAGGLAVPTILDHETHPVGRTTENIAEEVVDVARRWNVATADVGDGV